MSNTELKWWHVRWGLFGRGFKKIGLWLAIVLAAGWMLYTTVLSVLGFFQPWLAIRNLGKDPNAWIVPKAPSDKSLAQLSGATIEEYGYSIQTPWVAPSTYKGLGDLIESVTFRKDHTGMFFVKPSKQSDLLAQYRANPDARTLFSSQALQSNYDLMAAAMNATPKDAKWWRGPRENEGLLVLLVNKTVGMMDYHNIYTIGSRGIRGFQLGDPEKPPHRVQLHLYDAADRLISIDIFGDQEGSLTQAELNAMVASIRPVEKK
jgi:hypothetical protein